MTLRLLLFAIAVITAACNRGDNETVATMVANDDYQAAVANLSRMDRDRARDGGRNPTEVMAFFGIEPGMAVLDMFAGGGYYTELLAHVVGPDGKVVSHSNQAYANFVGDEANERYAGNRLPNVEILMAENNALDLPEAHFDVVTLILAYHDIYYEAPENGWPKIDGPRLLAELYNGLKPGGVLGVVDHVAEAGSPRETGGTLHRIDPAIVIEEIRGAGFILEGESDVLRNTQDDHLLNMADPSVRGKTDRFVLRFRKPE